MRVLAALALLLLSLSCARADAPAARRTAFVPFAPTLEIMAGQMLLVGFRGTGEKPLPADLVLLLEDVGLGRVGGVIYFDRDHISQTRGRNIKNTAQVRALSALLQEGAPIPLFIGVDQEGGKVRRLKEEHGFFPLPSARDMGRESPEQTRERARRLGLGLRSLGINLNFAPSLDVDINPESPAIGLLERSFSPDPLRVAAHGLAFAEGLFSAGVVPCYKHFPGHGSASHDTHLGLTDISATFRRAELGPYRRILPQSPPAMVMPGHIVHRELSRGLPSSLSSHVIEGLLRKQLGWRGVVVTDDLQMQAIGEFHSTKEALRLAVTAGADILLLGNNLRHDPRLARHAHALLLELVREGSISEERIRQSYERIMSLKRAAGLVR